MPVRRLVGVPPRRTGPTGAASPVGPDGARTSRCFGARLLVRGFQGGELLRQSLGTVSGVVVVRVDRRCRTHEQPCGTHPPLGRAVAQEFLWLPQRGGVSVRGADVDRGTNPAVAETSGARLPVSRDRSPSIRPSRSAITGPGRGLNGYPFCNVLAHSSLACCTALIGSAYGAANGSCAIRVVSSAFCRTCRCHSSTISPTPKIPPCHCAKPSKLRPSKSVCIGI